MTLDIVELIFAYINTKCREPEHLDDIRDIELAPDEAIEELNNRFKEHSIGYEFENNQNRLYLYSF